MKKQKVNEWKRYLYYLKTNPHFTLLDLIFSWVRKKMQKYQAFALLNFSDPFPNSLFFLPQPLSFLPVSLNSTLVSIIFKLYVHLVLSERLGIQMTPNFKNIRTCLPGCTQYEKGKTEGERMAKKRTRRKNRSLI